ncbi:hypothetical protein [Nocardia terpenica]|uniref:Uncharacterized protein n=1 Tax=Nocardia terpenica TaxID=455432 RepID=A0A164K1C7_9NOCA|nr:hypothetical protein [Nocardia terpenica]KZM70925.1 hypothetical protein AWN90_41100 [Nocardia terpenica]NQE89771.1 hypothetical protein [Nocardia terpenica]
MELTFRRHRITNFLRATERAETAPIPHWAVLILEALGAILTDQEILDANVATLATIADDLEKELAELKKGAPATMNFGGLDRVIARLRGDVQAQPGTPTQPGTPGQPTTPGQPGTGGQTPAGGQPTPVPGGQTPVPGQPTGQTPAGGTSGTGTAPTPTPVPSVGDGTGQAQPPHTA